ncbi:acyl-CoA thioesterase [Brevibacterium luteolum]|uniref:acyl-CoA thioesterase n=1 Tax=Brevibacterium luteolum TaxID=199591 RepID=UPI00223AA6A3|nr:thioesterase family protein [Brevibacterium luteolum]MCT1921100.1 acyl-CoA thioesterase [Brevibacterium luteolum]
MHDDHSPADFPLTTTDKLRYSDTDRQGHINNAVFATFFETGRVEIISQIDRHSEVSDREFVLARITIDYLQEVHWPGSVTIGSRVSRVGTSSLTVKQVIFVDETVCARAESVMVQIRTSTRRSEPFDDATREFFSTLS